MYLDPENFPVLGSPHIFLKIRFTFGMQPLKLGSADTKLDNCIKWHKFKKHMQGT